jgi:hypothetical protein
MITTKANQITIITELAKDLYWSRNFLTVVYVYRNLLRCFSAMEVRQNRTYRIDHGDAEEADGCN